MPLPVFVSRTIHHEAIDWATRVSSNGGTISGTVLRAVSDLCAAADQGSFRGAIYRLNPFAGGNLSGCLVPLYRGPTFGGTNFGNATDTNVNFVSADYSETGATGGLKGNGTNKYLNTGFSSNSLPSAASVHLSASATSMASSGDPVLLGSFNGTAAGLMVLDEFVTGSSARAFRHGTFAVNTFPRVTSPGSVESHIIGSRISSSSASLYRGGSLTNTNTTSVTPTSNALSIYVYNYGTTSGTPAATQYSAARMRMYSIGTGLDATQAAAFSAAVIAFNTTLGR
jgi:hypothetical protein